MELSSGGIYYLRFHLKYLIPPAVFLLFIRYILIWANQKLSFLHISKAKTYGKFTEKDFLLSFAANFIDKGSNVNVNATK